MKNSFFLFFLLFSSTYAAEPSAFGAGSLDSANPYGLTESERSIIENRRVSLSNQKLLRQQALKIEQLEETIEGLRSVVESMSNKIGKTGERLSEISSHANKVDSDEITALQTQLDALKKESTNNYLKIEKALKKLTGVMTNSKKKVESKPKKKVTKSNAQLIKDAVSNYRAKRYSKAKEIFTTLADKNYKPAQTNYYLGEIAYYRKNYDEAIYHYKKSVGYYDQASYMPTLLLHTALSFKKLGDEENAQRFFDTVLSTYPESAQANIAEKYLN